MTGTMCLMRRTATAWRVAPDITCITRSRLPGNHLFRSWNGPPPARHPFRIGPGTIGVDRVGTGKVSRHLKTPQTVPFSAPSTRPAYHVLPSRCPASLQINSPVAMSMVFVMSMLFVVTTLFVMSVLFVVPMILVMTPTLLMTAAAIAITVLVTRHVFVVVPVVSHKVDRPAAGVVFRAMPAPVLLVARPHVQVDRRG